MFILINVQIKSFLPTLTTNVVHLSVYPAPVPFFLCFTSTLNFWGGLNCLIPALYADIVWILIFKANLFWNNIWIFRRTASLDRCHRLTPSFTVRLAFRPYNRYLCIDLDILFGFATLNLWRKPILMVTRMKMPGIDGSFWILSDFVDLVLN